MACYHIMTVLVNHRSENAKEIQGVLTKHGCSVKMRLGLHEAGNVCSEEGLIILQLVDDEAKVNELQNELNELNGVQAKTTTICSQA